jgi:hypothetical protein
MINVAIMVPPTTMSKPGTLTKVIRGLPMRIEPTIRRSPPIIPMIVAISNIFANYLSDI